jgi:hypothetical protein
MTEVTFSSIGLSVHASSPIVQSIASEYDLRFSKEIESYQHVIGADGGFLSCTFTVKVSQVEIDDWLENGLARHIVVYNGETDVIWCGFVNKISFGIGALSATRGPLFDIANRVMVVYTPIIDTTVDPPVTGSATETPIAEDTDSQDRYGIIEKIISGGQLLDDGTTDTAEEIRDLYLEEYKYPFTDETITLGQITEPTMTVECLGYVEWLKAYVHNDYTASTTTLDAKVKNVLNDDPNTVFNTNQTFIESNAQLTNQYEDKNRFANTVIDELVKMGDASDNRWVFQVYEDQLCYYRAIPTETEYLHSLTSSAQNVSLLDGTEVRPWDMRPAVWVEITNFIIGQSDYPSLRQDPRVMFAERVTYTAPYGLAIAGARISTVTQRLAQLGVGGA